MVDLFDRVKKLMVELFDWVKDLLGEVSMIVWVVRLIVFGSWCYFYWAATNYVTIALWRGEFLEGFFGVSRHKEVELMGWGQYFASYCVTCVIICFPWLFMRIASLSDDGDADWENYGEKDSGWVFLDIGWIFTLGLLIGFFGIAFFALLRVIAFFLGYG